jgi:uncharacterized protein
MTSWNLFFSLLGAQALLGAFDNLWHHEWHAALPQRRSARRELALHAAREALYALIFLGLAWWAWHGAWAWLLAAMLVAEVLITLADFVEEDRTRALPPAERVLHTVLAMGYGVLLALLAPQLWRWAQQSTALVPVTHGLWSVAFSISGVLVGLWSLRNVLAVRALGRMDRQATNTAMSSLPTAASRRSVLVTGGTGFIGRRLVARLLRQGWRVWVYSRDMRQARALLGPNVCVIDRLDELPSETRLDAIVHLAGARVLGRPWTGRHRQTLLQSRVALTEALLRLVRRLVQAPQLLVAASAVGYYGAAPTGTVCDEEAPARPGEFASDLCAAVEHEARRAEAVGMRVLRLRLGLVLGAEDGAYPPQALATRCGLGAVLGTGAQPLPWIHVDDAVGLIHHALRTPTLKGALNAVAPERVTQRHFAARLASSFGRRVRLRVPAALLKGVMGEMSGLLLDGQAASADRALASGYVYRYGALDFALAALARRQG